MNELPGGEFSEETADTAIPPFKPSRTPRFGLQHIGRILGLNFLFKEVLGNLGRRKNHRPRFTGTVASPSINRSVKSAERHAHRADPIGLGSLQRLDQPNAPAERAISNQSIHPDVVDAAKKSPTMDAIFKAMQAQENATTPTAPTAAPAAAKKQALRQYASQQGNGKTAVVGRTQPAGTTRTDMLRTQRLNQELQTALKKRQEGSLNSIGQSISASASKLSASQTPFSSAASKNASPKKGSQKGNDVNASLPAGNPEVLNFLRNVADLMEQDGKTDIARNIHKNLNPNSLNILGETPLGTG